MRYSLASDLVSLGRHPEDGEEMIGEVFYLTATDAQGNRKMSPCFDSSWINSFRRDKRATELMTDKIMFMACRWCPMMIFACGIIAQGHDLITEGNLMLNVAEPQLDSTDWQPTYPEYGSVAYEREEPYIVERERQDDLIFDR